MMTLKDLIKERDEASKLIHVPFEKIVRDTEPTHGKAEKMREGAESCASRTQDNKVSGDSETH